MKDKTTSPKGGKRGCLCKDGKTYSKDCCSGELQAQGIGTLETPNRVVTINQDNNARTITRN